MCISVKHTVLNVYKCKIYCIECMYKCKARAYTWGGQGEKCLSRPVKQLYLNAKPRKLEFGGSKRPFCLNLDLIYFIHCTAVL